MKIERTITVNGQEYKFDYISSCYFFEELLARDDITIGFAAEIAPLLTQYYIDSYYMSIVDILEEVSDILNQINYLDNRVFTKEHATKIIKILQNPDSFLAETLFGTKED